MVLSPSGNISTKIFSALNMTKGNRDELISSLRTELGSESFEPQRD